MFPYLSFYLLNFDKFDLFGKFVEVVVFPLITLVRAEDPN